MGGKPKQLKELDKLRSRLEKVDEKEFDDEDEDASGNNIFFKKKQSF